MRTAQILILAALAPLLLAAAPFRVKLEGDRLRVASAPGGFIAAEALQRLRDGGSVAYIFRLGLKPERSGRPLQQAKHRFVVSYDLWEEKFAVSETEPVRRSISHLTQQAAETWCLDALSVPVAGINSTRNLWALLEFETEETRTVPASKDSGLSLESMIDVFSRKNVRTPAKGAHEFGPFTLTGLK